MSYTTGQKIAVVGISLSGAGTAMGTVAVMISDFLAQDTINAAIWTMGSMVAVGTVLFFVGLVTAIAQGDLS